MSSSPHLGLVLVTEKLDPENPAYIATQNFIDLYEDEASKISIIGPASMTIQRENVELKPIPRRTPSNIFLRIADYVIYQLKLAKIICDSRRSLDTVFFHLGGRLLLFPLLVCQLCGLFSVVFVTGPIKKGYSTFHEDSLVTRIIIKIIDLLQLLTNKLADRIVLLAETTESDDRSAPSQKTVTANLNYIDCGEFARKKPLDDRHYDVIFVGRLERVKGVDNFVKALPDLVQERPSVRVNLIGDGELRDELEAFVREEGLTAHVEFSGWVDHGEIADHLNEGHLLVLPSRSEGVPKAMLEAMACGTVPVATRVGGIPDIIEPGENGFLLDSNQPHEVANSLSKALVKEDLEAVSHGARETVYDNYSFDTIKYKYRKLLVN